MVYSLAMKNLALLLLILSPILAFASVDPVDGETIATLTTHSGFVPPQYSYSLSCTISKSGAVVREFTKGQVKQPTVTDKISKTKTFRMRVLIAAAKRGKIELAPSPCDIPGATVTAFSKADQAKPVIIYQRPGCSAQKTNTSDSAAKLYKMIVDLCDASDYFADSI